MYDLAKQGNAQVPATNPTRSIRNAVVKGAGMLIFALPLLALVLHRAVAHDVPTEANQRSTRPQHKATLDELLSQSQQLIGSGHAEEALAILEHHVADFPDSAPLRNNICVAHGLLKHRALAISACQAAIQVDPGFELAKRNLDWVTSLPGAYR